MDVVEQARFRRHPGRRRREGDVGGDAGERQRDQALGEAQEGGPVADPEDAGEREGDDEVGGVDEREGDVPPVDDAGLVEAGLEPFGRCLAEEEEAVEVDHRVRVDADPERVGGAAGEVVGAEHDARSAASRRRAGGSAAGGRPIELQASAPQTQAITSSRWTGTP